MRNLLTGLTAALLLTATVPAHAMVAQYPSKHPTATGCAASYAQAKPASIGGLTVFVPLEPTQEANRMVDSFGKGVFETIHPDDYAFLTKRPSPVWVVYSFLPDAKVQSALALGKPQATLKGLTRQIFIAVSRHECRMTKPESVDINTLASDTLRVILDTAKVQAAQGHDLIHELDDAETNRIRNLFPASLVNEIEAYLKNASTNGQ